MTDTVPANATALPSRRSVIAQAGMLASIGAAGATIAMPVLAAGNDEHLFGLYRRLVPLNELAADADRRVIAAEAVYDRTMPDIPEALIVRSDDAFKKMNTSPEIRRGRLTERSHYRCVDVDGVKERVATFSTPRGREILRGIDPRAEARLDRLGEIADSYATWEAARQSAWTSSGISEAQHAAEEAHARCGKIIEEIASCPATTLAGVMLKARAAAPCFGTTFAEAEEAIDYALLDDPGDGERLTLSILKDLLRMAQQNAEGGIDA